MYLVSSLHADVEFGDVRREDVIDEMFVLLSQRDYLFLYLENLVIVQVELSLE